MQAHGQTSGGGIPMQDLRQDRGVGDIQGVADNTSEFYSELRCGSVEPSAVGVATSDQNVDGVGVVGVS